MGTCSGCEQQRDVQAASSKGTVSMVPAGFRADSGTNLFVQGEIVTGLQGRPDSSVVRVIAGSARGPGFES